MRLTRKTRGQISIEFMFIMGLMFVLVISSVHIMSDGPNSAQAQTIRVSTLASAKVIGSTIATGVELVMPQAPMAKKTYIVTTGYLSKPSIVASAWGYSNPTLVIKITQTDVEIGVTNGGTTLTTTGTTKNAVQIPLTLGPSSPVQTTIPLSEIPPQLEIVVTKDPTATANSISYSSGVLTITLMG